MAKNLSHLMCMFLAEVKQGDALPSCFSSPTINKCPFCSLFSITFFALCLKCNVDFVGYFYWFLLLESSFLVCLVILDCVSLIVFNFFCKNNLRSRVKVFSVGRNIS